jgi:hypothetical protein
MMLFIAVMDDKPLPGKQPVMSLCNYSVSMPRTRQARKKIEKKGINSRVKLAARDGIASPL